LPIRTSACSLVLVLTVIWPENFSVLTHFLLDAGSGNYNSKLEGIANMHCVITGVAGFIGSSLCDRLLKDGHTVKGIDCFVDYYPAEIKRHNLLQAQDNARFEFIEEDLLSTNMDYLLEDADWVFHQAAQAGVRASWGEYFDSYCQNNVLATQRLLEASKGHKGIKKIVFASSSSIYGLAESFPTKENMRPQPISPYGVTKLASENLMTLYASEFQVPTASLRYFTVYGPRQRPDMAFNRFIRAALKSEELTLYSDGLQSRDFTYIDDIVQANVLAASNGEVGGVYNIGGGTQATMNEAIEIIRSHVGELSIRHEPRQFGDARHTGADTSAAKKVLGFAPRVSLAEGIGREVEWMKEHLATFTQK